MFLHEPEHTQFDLKWRMFGTDVRVHPLFWLVSIFLGWPLREMGLSFLALWVGCVFVSVLIHEFGHIAVGAFFGSPGHVVLYSFGGLAVGSNHLDNRGKRIAVCFAGPFAEFLLIVVLYFIFLAMAPGRAEAFLNEAGRLFGLRTRIDPNFYTETLLNQSMWFILEINLFWALMNLLPIYPLDGGQISRDFLTGVSRGKGLQQSLGISIFVAGLLAVNAAVDASTHKPLIPHLPGGGWYMALLFGLLALGNFQEMQQLGPRSGPGSGGRGRAPWERDPDYWKH